MGRPGRAAPAGQGSPAGAARPARAARPGRPGWPGQPGKSGPARPSRRAGQPITSSCVSHGGCAGDRCNLRVTFTTTNVRPRLHSFRCVSLTRWVLTWYTRIACVSRSSSSDVSCPFTFNQTSALALVHLYRQHPHWGVYRERFQLFPRACTRVCTCGARGCLACAPPPREFP